MAQFLFLGTNSKMKFFAVTLLILAVAQAAVVPRGNSRIGTKSTIKTAGSYGKIINGLVASRGQFPYQVALFIDSTLFCGGSLISTSWILTAAQCTFEHSEWIVYLGTHNIDLSIETGRFITSSHVAAAHEQYDPITRLNDIGVVQLPSPITQTLYIATTNLPKRSEIGNTYEGLTMAIAGWGRTSDIDSSLSPELHYALVPVISNGECEVSYGLLPPSVLCTSGTYSNICIGDSGSPLVDYTESVQIGVASHGASTSCQGGYPAIYSRITSYVEWISMHTGIPI